MGLLRRTRKRGEPMGSKWKIYRVVGTVKIQYDEIMSDNPKDAIRVCKDLTEEDGSFGPDTFEDFDLKAELLRPATKKEVIDGYGEEEWED